MKALATEAVSPQDTNRVSFFVIFVLMKNFGLFAIALKIGPKLLSILAKSTKFILVGASFAAYAYIFTWQFAVIILSMLIVHEYGHIWAMQRCGIKTKGIYLIPFVGGLAVSDGMAKSRWDEVYIALMGPIFGLALSVVSLVIYYATANPLFAATASWMAMVNIINLFPITPLDGGRVLKAVTLSIDQRVGFAYMLLALFAMLAAVVFLGLWTFVVLIIIGGLELYFEYEKHKLQETLTTLEKHKPNLSEEGAKLVDELIEKHRDNTEKMDVRKMIQSMSFYLVVLVALFVVMTLMSHVPGADLAMEMLK